MSKTTKDNRSRIRQTIQKHNNEEDIVEVFVSAISLQRSMYNQSKEAEDKFLFRLRKSLEGLFGHDLPGEDTDEPSESTGESNDN